MDDRMREPQEVYVIPHGTDWPDDAPGDLFRPEHQSFIGRIAQIIDKAHDAEEPLIVPMEDGDFTTLANMKQDVDEADFVALRGVPGMSPTTTYSARMGSFRQMEYDDFIEYRRDHKEEQEAEAKFQREAFAKVTSSAETSKGKGKGKDEPSLTDITDEL